jgi:hypothetical protein
MKNIYKSGEYSPTPSHGLPAFVNGMATGYMCRACGHIQKDLDPVFDDLCLICLKNWALKNGVSRLLPTAEVLEAAKALEPTVKIDLSKEEVTKKRSQATTVIIKNHIV